MRGVFVVVIAGVVVVVVVGGLVVGWGGFGGGVVGVLGRVGAAGGDGGEEEGGEGKVLGERELRCRGGVEGWREVWCGRSGVSGGGGVWRWGSGLEDGRGKKGMRMVSMRMVGGGVCSGMSRDGLHEECCDDDGHAGEKEIPVGVRGG